MWLGLVFHSAHFANGYDDSLFHLRPLQAFRSQTRSFATSAGASAKRLHPNVLGLVVGAGVVGAAAGTLISRARCSDDVLVSAAYPWSHKSEWKSYDVARCASPPRSLHSLSLQTHGYVALSDHGVKIG
jgi:hypothetical protein